MAKNNECRIVVKFPCGTEDPTTCGYARVGEDGRCNFFTDGCDCVSRDAQLAALILYKGRMVR